jgi:hypothetical protein
LPLSLIKKIVTFRLKKDFEKAASKKWETIFKIDKSAFRYF